MKPCRGSGFAEATTINIWSMFAAMVFSNAPASSIVLDKEFFLGLTETMRARVPSLPDTSPTNPTWSPTTTEFLPSSRAFIALTSKPEDRRHKVRPRSTVITCAGTASS